MSKNDLRGRKFGRLLVLEELEERKSKCVVWKCQCECGKIINVVGYYLTTNTTTSCGCKGTNNIDRVGHTYGKMKVLAQTDKRKNKSIVWECQCEYCGKHKELSTAQLIHSDLDGCGCKRAKHIKEINKFYQGTSIRQLEDKKNRKNNKTGVKGVHESNGRYIAQMMFQRKKYYLGCYATLEEAANARKIAESKLHKPVIEAYKKENEEKNK